MIGYVNEQLWRAIEEIAVPSDYWCHTHHCWNHIDRCDEDCFVVPVFMRQRDGSPPFAWFTTADEVARRPEG